MPEPYQYIHSAKKNTLCLTDGKNNQDYPHIVIDSLDQGTSIIKPTLNFMTIIPDVHVCCGLVDDEDLVLA